VNHLIPSLPPKPLEADLTQAVALCYALGALSEQERFEAEVQMERDAHFRKEMLCRLEVAAESLLAGDEGDQSPSFEVKQRVLRSIDALAGIDRFMASFAPSQNDCVVVTDDKTHITWVNSAFIKMCGYSLNELKGKKPGRLLHGPLTSRRAIRRLRQAVRRASVCTEELVNYHKDGQPYWVRLTISPIADASGHARGWIAIEKEIVEKKIPRS
jgi:PAS domain S-box-containing protein